MLCGEQLDFHPENDNETNHSSNATDYIKLCRNISSEAQSCLGGLLETDPKKRLGSPNSPHGSIREHPFFNVGRQMDWEEIDDGIFKSMHKRRAVRDQLIYYNNSIFFILVDANYVCCFV